MALALPSEITAKVENSNIHINFRQSACVPLPNQNEGTVRFFVQLVNTGGVGAYGHTIHFVWQRIDGSWKDSFLNVIEKGQLRVRGHSGKRYYADFGADPSKPIIACGLKIDDSMYVHRIRVIA